VRRVRNHDNRERGAISVIVAILMVCLLGFAALAVDVGTLYAERAQVQNGSDSVALMVAQKCAKNASDAECSGTWPRATGLASQLANGNALDGLTNIKSVTLDKTKRSVSVDSGAKQTGSPTNSISLFFARALGIPNAEVAATSHAQWGTPSKGTVILPLVIAECKFNLTPGSTVAVEQVLEFGSGCGRVPGGFGWIKGTGAQCSVSIGVGNAGDSGTWFESDPGASEPSRCTAADLSKMNNQQSCSRSTTWQQVPALARSIS
jgi:Flp pilus assembly protein TadG